MNAKMIILTLLTLLIASMAIATADVSLKQLEQSMAKSAGNISSYTFSKSTDSSAQYSNASIEKKLEVFKTTAGNVDLRNEAAWWSSKMATQKNGKALNWQSYFVNGSAYLNVGKNWTKHTFNNTSRINSDFNIIPGEIALIKNSDMSISGSEKVAGKDYYKLTGRPNDQVYKLIIGRQILSALYASQIKLPEALRNKKVDLDKSALMNQSKIAITAWVSKDDSLLKRMDINSSLTITPQILNVSSTNFKIYTTLNESTIFDNFGSLVKIVLPKDAQNESSLLKGAAWSHAVLGSVNSMNKLV